MVIVVSKQYLKSLGYTHEQIQDYGTGGAYENDIEGIKRAKIISAVELKKDFMEKIEKKLGDLTNSKVIGVNEIDESIVGGIVVRFSDQVLDMSIKGEFFKMRDSFSKSNI